MITISPIPAFDDNYVWLLQVDGRSSAAAVDPGDAAPVLRELEHRNAWATAVLVTHHHGDHTGGVASLVEHGAAAVYGPARERIPALDHPVDDGATVTLDDLGIELEVMAVPGHTAGHVAYRGPGFVLSGDALFAGGCGRIFEGTPEEMYRSLNRLAALPPETEVYCAHEYTLGNLRFALDVEPDNLALQRRFESARDRRSRDEPTVPSTIALELETNPFLRCAEPAVMRAAESRAGGRLSGPSEVFAVIREWKDGWRG
jgi:hydroxyacylglutathione hydrolase